MNGAERRDFVRSHRTAIFGYNRREHGPALTAVYYVMDGDDLLVSTMTSRGKAKAVRRDPHVSMCVLDEKWPPRYILVYGTAKIETDFEVVVAHLVKIMELMAERALPPDTRQHCEEIVRREDRIILRVTPYMTFETPPRHVYKPEDVKGLTHWVGASLPWDA